MNGLRTWINGALVAAGEARISAYDRGFRSGHGVFETFRAYGDHVFRLDDHIDRAREGARVLGFDPGPHGRLAEAVATTAAANLNSLDGADSALRLTTTPGSIDPHSPFPGAPTPDPTVVVTSHRLARDPRLWKEGARAASVQVSRELPEVKAVSRLTATMARRHAREHGADEALLTTSDGDVLEGATSNVFAVVDDQLVTPPLAVGLLAGVTRQVVLELAAERDLVAVQRPLSLSELCRADEALLTSTTREIVPLVATDGHTIGSGRPGRVTRRLLAAYRSRVQMGAQSDDPASASGSGPGI